jgi:hypothetical protein
MSETCSTHGSDEKFLSGNLRGRNHLEYIGIVEKMILEWILEK